MKIRLILILAFGLFSQTVMALQSDSEQPATLEADDFEIDFNTGVRTYRGNVIFRQGSIKLTCDELVTYLNSDDELDKAICIGSPGRFKQRPEGGDVDMIGTANEITMDEVAQLVILKSRAKVEQAGSVITGRLITYNRATEKASVKGGSQGGQKSTQTAGSSAEESSDASTGSGTTTAVPEEDTGSSRPSLTIQPRKKKKKSE